MVIAETVQVYQACPICLGAIIIASPFLLIGWLVKKRIHIHHHKDGDCCCKEEEND